MNTYNDANAAPRLSSAEIVAVTTELRHRQANRRRKKGEKKKDEDADDNKRELVMEEHKKSVSELVADLGTDAKNGMSTLDIERRLEVEGHNKLSPPKQTPEIIKYIRELTGLFSQLLWLGGTLCIILYLVQGDPNNLYLGIVLFLVVIVTGTFSYSQNRKSSNLMESFKSMMPTMATVIREGNSQKVDATQLVRGDLVVLKGGDKVPADIRIIECSDDLTVDNSCLTGEPEPLKRVIECTDENPLETKNLCFFGTFVPQGSGKGIVVRIGDKTVMGRIAHLATSTATIMTPIAREINHFVHIIAVVAVTIGIIFFIIGFIIKTDVVSNVVLMIGIIVANVPEGLLATVTVCLSLAANRMANKSVLVKNLEGVETLGSTSCICSDKTGTLTQNVMTVANVVYNNQIHDAECSITPRGSYNLQDPSFIALQRCATLCNNAVFDEESKYEKVQAADGSIVKGKSKPFKETITTSDGSAYQKVLWDTIGDASESAMIKFCHDKRDIFEYRTQYSKLKEIPFNSKNKYQLSVHQQENDTEKPLLLLMKGAPERITIRCDSVMINGEIIELTQARRDEIEACQLELSKKGMRVLGFAQKVLDRAMYPSSYEFNTDNPNFPLGEKDVDYDIVPKPDSKIEEPLCFLGLMALIDPPRPEVPPAVEKCKTAGIRVIMVTGDHPVTAKAIAHKVGILWGPTCEDLEEENVSRNLQVGDPGYINPSTAPAIVVPGWTISIDTPVEEWDRILDHNQIVFARTSPQQKLIIVENCQRRKHIVAVTGDGVNDSPALKKADIGIAMGIMGSAVSKEAADMILLDDNFASIVHGVEEGRIIFDNLKKSIAYALAVNIPELVPFLFFAVLRIPLPLTTILMLAICLGTDMIPAISMAYERAENDIMLRAPRNAAVDHLVTKKLVCFSYAVIGIIQAAAGMFTYYVVMNDFGYPPSILPELGFQDSFGKQVLWCKISNGKFCTAGGLYKSRGRSEPLSNVRSQYGGQECSPYYDDRIPNGGNVFDAFIFYDQGSDGKIEDCQYPFMNFKPRGEKPQVFDRGDPSTYGRYTAGTPVVSFQAMQAAYAQGYRPYYPLKARLSSFFNKEWFSYPTYKKTAPGFKTKLSTELFFGFQPIGLWAIDDSEPKGSQISALGRAKDAYLSTPVNVVNVQNKEILPKMFELSNKVYISGENVATIKPTNSTTSCIGQQCLLDYHAGFTLRDGNGFTTVNIASRMLQSNSLRVAQTAFFVAVVQVQWANILICKTRYLSVTKQGMLNSVLNFGLMFELMLCAVVSYAGFVHSIFGTQSMRLVHWFPALPFAVFIVIFDETRKGIMRVTSRSKIDKATGRMIRYPGWLEVNTYY